MDSVLKYILIGFLINILIFLTVSCTRAKTFKGQVVDADTKEPIEGAVVVVLWETERTTPTATHTDLKDVKECLTNKDGEWSVTGPRGRANELIPGLSLFIPYTKEPQFTIFKPGYCSWPNGFSIDACKDRMKVKGGQYKKIGEGGTLELPKLNVRHRTTIIQNIPSLGAGDAEVNLPLFKKLVDQEEKEIRR